MSDKPEETTKPEETKPEETKPEETKPQEPVKRKLKIPKGDGTFHTAELSDEEYEEVAMFGAAKWLQEQQGKKEEPKKKSPPPEDESETEKILRELKETKEEVKKQREEFQQEKKKQKDAQLLNNVQQLVKSIPEFKGREKFAEKAIMADIAAGKSEKEILLEVEELKKVLGGAKVNPEKKEKDKEETAAGTASGQEAGREKPKPLTRHDLSRGNRGRMVDRVRKHVDELKKKNEE